MTVVDGRPPYGSYTTIVSVFGGGLASARGPPRASACTQILAPRFGRLRTWTLAAARLNDWLQAGFAVVTAKANELEKRS